MNWIFLYLIVHVVCAIISMGLMFAQFQRSISWRRADWFQKDRKFCTYMGIGLGPIALVTGLIVLTKHGFYGFLWPWGKGAEEEAGILDWY